LLLGGLIFSFFGAPFLVYRTTVINDGVCHCAWNGAKRSGGAESLNVVFHFAVLGVKTYGMTKIFELLD
jgi:hypothetical protein